MKTLASLAALAGLTIAAGCRCRVVPPTEEKQATNVDAKGAGKPSNEIAVTSPGIWKFTVLMPTPDPNEEGKGKVFLQIEKFDPKTGQTAKVSKVHPEGGRIGFWDGTFVHRVSLPDGRSIEVDFDCGAVLKSVEKVEIKLRWRECAKKFNEKGAQIGCDIVSDETTEQTFSRVRVVILDSEKRPIVIHHPDYPPQPPDQLCEKHRDEPPQEPEPPKK